MQALRLAYPPEVPLDRHVDVDDAARPPSHDQLVHVVHVGREHGPPLGQRHHRQRSGLAVGGEARPVDGIHGDVDLGFQPVADLLAEEEHRRLVLLALADHDGAAHVDRGQPGPHGVDRPLVGLFLHAPALERSRGEGGALGHAQQLEGEVPIHQLFAHGPTSSSHV
jgi:hypothetical protein